MTWDLREQTLVALWEAEGHKLRPMTTGWGAAICLRCETVVHIRSRAQALISDDNRFWSDVDPGAIKPCKPRAS